MQYTKQVIDSLEKCYSLSALSVGGMPHLLVAAEKQNPCYLFDLAGNRVDTVWDAPGGVMTMVPVPGKEGTFLATHKFYSPNDSKEAMLVCAKKTADGWKITKLTDLPFVHRFDLIESGGVTYVLACTLKSDHEYKNDWRFPGKLQVAALSDDPEAPLEMTVIKEGLTHNHGYTRFLQEGQVTGIVSADEGVFQVIAPQKPGEEWQIRQLLDQPTSDAVLIDLDGDGQEELFTLSPFHGDQITIWHLQDGAYVPVWEYPEKTPFLHAIYSGTVYGRPTVYAGNREGDQFLAGFYYDQEQKQFAYEIVDCGAGPANCMLFSRNGHPAILAANRETDEIAIYDIDRD